MARKYHTSYNFRTVINEYFGTVYLSNKLNISVSPTLSFIWKRQFIFGTKQVNHEFTRWCNIERRFNQWKEWLRLSERLARTERDIQLDPSFSAISRFQVYSQQINRHDRQQQPSLYERSQECHPQPGKRNQAALWPDLSRYRKTGRSQLCQR